MSSAASNYDVSRLVFGAVIISLSLVLTIPVASFCLKYFSFTSLYLVAVILSYGIMMFASSYVEEEQHFWYWSTAAWISCLFLFR